MLAFREGGNVHTDICGGATIPICGRSSMCRKEDKNNILRVSLRSGLADAHVQRHRTTG